MKDNLLTNIERGNDSYLFTTPDGTIQFHANFKYLTKGYETLVDLENGTYGETGKTINKHIEDGSLTTKSIVKDETYEVAGMRDRNTSKRFTAKKAQEVIAYFKSKGLTVSEEGLMHNYYAWLKDYKSGYRDEVNRVFIFTPCGCNSLSFNVTELDEYFDWQESTYEC